MELVADESCAAPVVRALRDAGHDVIAIAESAPGSKDSDILAHAVRSGRVLITEDSDFGELVYGRARSSAGIVLVRFPTSLRKTKPRSVVEAIAKLGARLRGAFVVVEPGRVRISARPVR